MVEPAAPPELHKPACAKSLQQEGESAGLQPRQIARRIHDHCGVTLLRAFRLALGITLEDAAAALRTLPGAAVRGAPKIDRIQLGHWESGKRTPKAATIGLLCRFYGSSPVELGFEDTASKVLATKLSTTQTVEADDDRFGRRVDHARRVVDRTLATSSVSAGQLDLLDEQVLESRQRYVYTPPEPMIDALMTHLDEVIDLAAERQPAAVQVHLSELTAMLSTLIADGLMKLGRLTQSEYWYRTARHAADDSGNNELRARVRAQAAMLPFYYGPLETAVALTREARMLCHGRPSTTGAFAAAAEARAQAKLGNEEAAVDAINHAARIYEQSGSGGRDNDAWAFPERRFHLYVSGTYTALGRTRQARQAQTQALALYPEQSGIDPALLRLEGAICLAHERSPAEACEMAGNTYLSMAPAHRTPIIEERARDVLTTLPPAVRNSRSARELTQLLALPPGQM
ncbi:MULTISPECIES: helix-turn-helix domain-containing protein [unclassified Streptomyces]|uniref:helix-turn-helix domain-containing protein n=1 Tax=unclassified Streptomyces TaxID=2593676 RepID=UPI0037AD41E9